MNRIEANRDSPRHGPSRSGEEAPTQLANLKDGAATHAYRGAVCEIESVSRRLC